MWGCYPLCASTLFEGDAVKRYPKFSELIKPVSPAPPRVDFHLAPTDHGFIGYKDRRILSILNKESLNECSPTCWTRMNFLSPHGIRSLSRYHENIRLC